MAKKETEIGGTVRDFPTTLWSDVLRAGDPSSPECREILNQLLQKYWKPVYAYIRTAWKKSIEDSKDLAQAFFTHILYKGYLAHLRPELGSFRGYLKQALKHFLIDAERAASVRRPKGPMLSLDVSREELELLGAAVPNESPDLVYDREWFRCLLEGSLKKTEKELRQKGKGDYFEAMRMYCIEPETSSVPRVFEGPSVATPTYGDIGKRLGMREQDVANALRHCRRVLRRILAEQIREYAATDPEVEKELEEFLKHGSV